MSLSLQRKRERQKGRAKCSIYHAYTNNTVLQCRHKKPRKQYHVLLRDVNSRQFRTLWRNGLWFARATIPAGKQQRPASFAAVAEGQRQAAISAILWQSVRESRVSARRDSRAYQARACSQRVVRDSWRKRPGYVDLATCGNWVTKAHVFVD